MTKQQKLLPCVCGKQAKMISGKYAYLIACGSACAKAVSAENAGHTIIMWNASMKALTEAKNGNID